MHLGQDSVRAPRALALAGVLLLAASLPGGVRAGPEASSEAKAAARSFQEGYRRMAAEGELLSNLGNDRSLPSAQEVEQAARERGSSGGSGSSGSPAQTQGQSTPPPSRLRRTAGFAGNHAAGFAHFTSVVAVYFGAQLLMEVEQGRMTYKEFFHVMREVLVSKEAIAGYFRFIALYAVADKIMRASSLEAAAKAVPEAKKLSWIAKKAAQIKNLRKVFLRQTGILVAVVATLEVGAYTLDELGKAPWEETCEDPQLAPGKRKMLDSVVRVFKCIFSDGDKAFRAFGHVMDAFQRALGRVDWVEVVVTQAAFVAGMLLVTVLVPPPLGQSGFLQLLVGFLCAELAAKYIAVPIKEYLVNPARVNRALYAIHRKERLIRGLPEFPPTPPGGYDYHYGETYMPPPPEPDLSADLDLQSFNSALKDKFRDLDEALDADSARELMEKRVAFSALANASKGKLSNKLTNMRDHRWVDGTVIWNVPLLENLYKPHSSQYLARVSTILDQAAEESSETAEDLRETLQGQLRQMERRFPGLRGFGEDIQECRARERQLEDPDAMDEALATFDPDAPHPAEITEDAIFDSKDPDAIYRPALRAYCGVQPTVDLLIPLGLVKGHILGRELAEEVPVPEGQAGRKGAAVQMMYFLTLTYARILGDLLDLEKEEATIEKLRLQAKQFLFRAARTRQEENRAELHGLDPRALLDQAADRSFTAKAGDFVTSVGRISSPVGGIFIGETTSEAADRLDRFGNRLPTSGGRGGRASRTLHADLSRSADLVQEDAALARVRDGIAGELLQAGYRVPDDPFHVHYILDFDLKEQEHLEKEAEFEEAFHALQGSTVHHEDTLARTVRTMQRDLAPYRPGDPLDQPTIVLDPEEAALIPTLDGNQVVGGSLGDFRAQRLDLPPAAPEDGAAAPGSNRSGVLGFGEGTQEQPRVVLIQRDQTRSLQDQQLRLGDRRPAGPLRLRSVGDRLFVSGDRDLRLGQREVRLHPDTVRLLNLPFLSEDPRRAYQPLMGHVILTYPQEFPPLDSETPSIQEHYDGYSGLRYPASDVYVDFERLMRAPEGNGAPFGLWNQPACPGGCGGFPQFLNPLDPYRQRQGEPYFLRLDPNTRASPFANRSLLSRDLGLFQSRGPPRPQGAPGVLRRFTSGRYRNDAYVWPGDNGVRVVTDPESGRRYLVQGGQVLSSDDGQGRGQGGATPVFLNSGVGLPPDFMQTFEAALRNPPFAFRKARSMYWSLVRSRSSHSRARTQYMRISGAVDSGRRELYPENFDPNRLIPLETAPTPRN